MHQNWKRDAIKNYFPLPNEIFSLGLSGGEILVYSYLMYCEDRKTFQCHPSYRTIGEAVGMSKNTVRKYVAELEKKLLITTEPTDIFTKSGLKHNGSLRYTILPMQKAIEYHDEKQFQKAEQEAAKNRALQKLAQYDKKHPRKAVSDDFDTELF
jgi:predicted transcriptional regulator